MYTYDDYDYEEDVINESALDMAIDMSDRYGVAVEDAYDFALEKVDPDRIWLNVYGVRKKYSDPYSKKISDHTKRRDALAKAAREYREGVYDYDKRVIGHDKDWHVQAANAASYGAYNHDKRIKKLMKERADFIGRLGSAKGVKR